MSLISFVESSVEHWATILTVGAVAAVLARLLVLERGPLGIFADFRYLMFLVKGIPVIGGEIHALASCVYCLSTWIIFAMMFMITQDLAHAFFFTLVGVCEAWVIFGFMRLPEIPDDNPRGLLTRIIKK